MSDVSLEVDQLSTRVFRSNPNPYPSIAHISASAFLTKRTHAPTPFFHPDQLSLVDTRETYHVSGSWDWFSTNHGRPGGKIPTTCWDNVHFYWRYAATSCQTRPRSRNNIHPTCIAGRIIVTPQPVKRNKKLVAIDSCKPPFQDCSLTEASDHSRRFTAD
jgi:hypothetical protein